MGCGAGFKRASNARCSYRFAVNNGTDDSSIGNRVTCITYPDGTSRQYVRNKLDLASVSDRQNRTTNYAYDADRNLVSVSVTEPEYAAGQHQQRGQQFPARWSGFTGTLVNEYQRTQHVNVMDVAGPWEVFADTSIKDAHGKDVSPYKLYTVAATTKPVRSEGANHAGLAITPDYDFAHAPTPDIVVVPAQMGGKDLQAWLRKIHAQHVTIMSVCTGAFQLAHAGLLKGKSATTHHWFFGNFAREFPDVKLVKQVRYVQADPITFTAGGLTSGIDLALHMVADRFGQGTAQQTADFMEYLGTGWKTDRGISPLAMPITRRNWSGIIDGNKQVVLHEVTYGASPILTLDIPSQNVKAASVAPTQHGNKVTLDVAIPGHPITISGLIDAASETFTGTFTQNGKSEPLSLKPVRPAPSATTEAH